MWYNKNIYIRTGGDVMRGDIDTRLLDYFLYDHADIDKAHSLVVIPENSLEKNKDVDIPAAEKMDHNH
jgi:type IV secretory pathway VirD2 relaxase